MPGQAKAASPKRMANRPRSAIVHQLRARTTIMIDLLHLGPLRARSDPLPRPGREPGSARPRRASLDFHGRVFHPANDNRASGIRSFSRISLERSVSHSMTDLSKTAVPTRYLALVFKLGLRS